MNAQLFFANWRTTLTGIGAAITSLLTILAALPYELGDVAAIFPPEWKAKIAIIGAVATAILKVLNSAAAKDAAVSGIGTVDDPARTPTKDGTRSQILPIILLLPILPMLGGCAWSQAHKAQLAATGELLATKAATIAGRVILSAAVSELDGTSKGNFLDSAAQGLRTSMPDIVTAEDVANVVKVWTPDKPHWGELADQVAAAYQAAPGAPAQKIEAVAEGLNVAAQTARQ